jgi:hypothetical protein
MMLVSETTYFIKRKNDFTKIEQHVYLAIMIDRYFKIVSKGILSLM